MKQPFKLHGKHFRRRWLRTFLFLLILLHGYSHIALAKGANIPEELEQWIPWVLYEQEEQMCTLAAEGKNNHYCVWPSKLNLDVIENGATFKQNFTVESKSLVFLPGKAPFWPENVTSNSKEIPVIEHKGRPAVWLTPGKYQLSGKFSWRKMPDYLLIPTATGRVQLSLHGKEVTDLQLDQSGQLWFKKTEKPVKSQGDALGIQVFRKISDGIPLTQQLQILLTVSGAPREITLGLSTAGTLIPLWLRSPLPIRLDKKGRLQLQVRPGQWKLEMTLRNTKNRSPKTFSRGVIDGLWPDHEIWVFAADTKLRQVEVSGLPPIDPSRTSLPEGWKSLPAYMQSGDEQMILTEKYRGNPNPTPNHLIIKRKLWLDEEGTGLTVLDGITGTMREGWRLNVDPRQVLGKVSVAGESRLITTLPGSDKVGVEVRQGRLQLTAESRIEQRVQTGQLIIPAPGWDHDFQKLSAELNLPPGWKLFTATGIDYVPTWLNNWTLLDIFLVLIIALATGKILGFGWGTLTLITMVLTYHQPGSPRYIWLPLIALIAVQKLISVQSGARILRAATFLTLGIIIIHSIPFMVNEIRTGIYPQLEYGKHHRIMQEIPPNSPVMGDALMDKEDKEALDAGPSPRNKIQASEKSMTSWNSSYMTGKTPPPPRAIRIDPQAMIQTGPGLPIWNWKKLIMIWNGPVRPNQVIHLFLLSPAVNTVLAFIRVLLLGGMILGFLRECLQRAKTFHAPAHSASMLLFFVSVAFFSSLYAQSAHAEIPSPEILTELQNRLLAPPQCGKNCAAINFCEIHIDKDLLQIHLRINTLTQSAVPLPGENRFFDSIILDNKEADALRISQKGFTLIRLQPGMHNLTLSKNLQGMNKVSLTFPMLPQKTESNLQGWSISGLRENGALDKQLTLTVLDKGPGVSHEIRNRDLNTIHIKPFVEITRTLHMGLKWSIETMISRRSPKSVIALDIPLLTGERVITDNLQIIKNRVKVNMGVGQQHFKWLSSLEPVDSITLTAEDTSSWTEKWFLDVSPIWHVQTEGIPEINQTNPSGRRYPEYQPYPGESLQLYISKPKGIPGKFLTITKSSIMIKQGKRAADVTLHFSLTASRGLRHNITLPPDAELQKTMINGKEIPLQLENNQLIIPVQPGTQNLEISWRSMRDVPLKLVSQAVDLGTDSVNHSIEITLPYSRWILLAGGPRIGPAVLFWGELLVIILVALLLGRIRFTPLSTLQWLLLSLGLSQVPTFLGAVVVVWLLLLGLRREKGHEIKQPIAFNLAQVFLIFLTLAALGVLFFAIQQGLLGSPDMQVSGNGSTNHILHWYQDRNQSLLPNAWVITVPLMVYRISMLLWALWLATALLRWLQWGWECFTTTVTWKTPVARSKKKSVPPVKKTVKKKAVSDKKQSV